MLPPLPAISQSLSFPSCAAPARIKRPALCVYHPYTRNPGTYPDLFILSVPIALLQLPVLKDLQRVLDEMALGVAPDVSTGGLGGMGG